MVLRDVRKGIEQSLSSGKRLYDDAESLYIKKRYHTSIPLYILAYEEFAKAKFLGKNYVTNKETEDSEFREITRGGAAHIKKVLVDSQEFRRFIETGPDDRVAAQRQFAEKVGLPFIKQEKQDAIELDKKFDRLFEKLSLLKMSMLYVDYKEDEWQSPKRFNDNKLRELCEYLRYEVIRPYHDVRMNLFFFANGIDTYKVPTDEQVMKIKQNADYIAKIELDRIYRTPHFAGCLNTTLSIIDSL